MNKRVQIIALVLLLAFLLPFALPFIRNLFSEKRNQTLTEEYLKNTSTSTAPVFKKEGELSFIKKDNQQEIKKIDIEIADSDGERQQGLMYRTQLEDSQGMLFIFPETEMQSFWMKNTLISLDILFVNENMEIVTIQKYAQPKSEQSLRSTKPAKYVVEVNAGFCDRYQVNEGDLVKF
ncbi:DUF192 domain-containing protein [Thermoflexibacter ruber]|uniref:DUF192 domain-containing protein n=1 Tax=Thermoflexibacter ruber TaxID=1003 RepID=A0A1I2B7T1_9BACT|nr:DUF192 domain-containing protein [Thermoflexibacter ruber]SFE52201.1 hypothetical protein SAMN04488541_1002168 [Thermoflexibacter ruber]